MYGYLALQILACTQCYVYAFDGISVKMLQNFFGNVGSRHYDPLLLLICNEGVDVLLLIFPSLLIRSSLQSELQQMKVSRTGSAASSNRRSGLFTGIFGGTNET